MFYTLKVHLMGNEMFYRLFINYLRLKMLRMVINGVTKSKFVKSKNLKTISIMTYGLELLGSYFLRPRKK